MKNIDRGILLALACGVWFLVLKPTAITAHDDTSFICYIHGKASGWVDDDYAEINEWRNSYVKCSS